MKGRKPTPTALKILNGNPGRRPLSGDEPQPDGLDEQCPDELIDPVARAEWDRAIVPAIAIGQITASDRSLAIAHCELWAMRRAQLAEAATYATHVIPVGSRGYSAPNPGISMAHKTLILLLKVDGELGFSPVSRSRVHVKKNRSPKSALDQRRAKFFGGGG